MKFHLKWRPRGSGLKTGMSPGTMVFIGERRQERARIDVIHFHGHELTEQRDVSVERCGEISAAPGVTWINVTAIHDIALIRALGRRFGLHPLTLEDLVNTGQRLKAEEFDEYLFVVLKMISFDDQRKEIRMEHVSLILGHDFVISFLEDEGDLFDPLRERLRSSKGRIRSMEADYLAYALIDTVVDHYFLVTERIGGRIEEVEDRILDDPAQDDVIEIHRLRRSMLALRRAVWPLREEIGMLVKLESPLIRAETKVFWRDLYDHIIHVIDIVETSREMLTSLQDTYLSRINNRMNEVMKVLTIIATIFIPLTFIAGVYGMNFEHMPELAWRWGYPAAWAVMLAVAVGLVLFFRRRKWL